MDASLYVEISRFDDLKKIVFTQRGDIDEMSKKIDLLLQEVSSLKPVQLSETVVGPDNSTILPSQQTFEEGVRDSRSSSPIQSSTLPPADVGSSLNPLKLP